MLKSANDAVCCCCCCWWLIKCENAIIWWHVRVYLKIDVDTRTFRVSFACPKVQSVRQGHEWTKNINEKLDGGSVQFLCNQKWIYWPIEKPKYEMLDMPVIFLSKNNQFEELVAMRANLPRHLLLPSWTTVVWNNFSCVFLASRCAHNFHISVRRKH